MVEVLLSGIVLGLVPVTILGLFCCGIFTVPPWKPIWSVILLKSFTKTKKLCKSNLLLLNNFFCLCQDYFCS